MLYMELCWELLLIYIISNEYLSSGLFKQHNWTPSMQLNYNSQQLGNSTFMESVAHGNCTVFGSSTLDVNAGSILTMRPPNFCAQNVMHL